MRCWTWLSLLLVALLCVPSVSLAAPKPTAGGLKKILQDDQGRKIYLDKKTVTMDEQGNLLYWVKIQYPDTVPMAFEGKKVAYMLQHRMQHCANNLLAPSDLEYYFDARNTEVGMVDTHSSKAGPPKMKTPKQGSTEAKMFSYVCEKYSYRTPQSSGPQD